MPQDVKWPRPNEEYQRAISEVRNAFRYENIEMVEVAGSIAGSIAATLRSLGWPKSAVTRPGYLTVEEFRESKQEPAKPVERNHSAISNMTAALRTYAERNATYGNSYHNFGKLMMVLFSNGLFLKSVEDFNRYGVIFMKASKLLRYTADPHRGHLDSIHDDGVYSFMLEELDSIAQGLPVRLGRNGTDMKDCQHVWKRNAEGDEEECIICPMSRYIGQTKK